MRGLQEYKAEIFRRSEIRIAWRKKTEKTGRDPLYRMHVVRDLCVAVSANRVPDRENGHPRF